MHTLRGNFNDYLVFLTLREGENIRYVIPLEDGDEHIDEFIQSHDTMEIIIVASDSALTPGTIVSSFGTLDTHSVRMLDHVSLGSPERLLMLLSSNKQRMSPNFDGTQKLITDNHPSIEFTAPINMIRQEILPASEIVW